MFKEWVWPSWLIGLAFLLVLFGLIVTVHAKSVPQVMIHDQRHLLSTEQRQQIIQANQRWRRQRHQPAIWIYTLKKLPSEVTDDPAFGTRNEDAVMSFRSFTEAVLQKNARYDLPDHLNEDRQTATLQQANRDGQRVSFIIVYPFKKGLRTIMVPSDDLNKATSDLQNWLLTYRLPSKQGSATSVMAYFNRYRPFIAKHVANVKTIKHGPSWSAATFWLFLAILIPWLVIRRLTHRGSRLYWDAPGNDSFGEGYFWGWFDNDHFDGGNGGWGPR